jgi:hypothetical protein
MEDAPSFVNFHRFRYYLFFDLEEPLHFQTETMGSVYFTKHCPIDLNTVDCAIILDLCGHDISMADQLPALGGVASYIPASVLQACPASRENGVLVLGTEQSRDLLNAVQSIPEPRVDVYPFRHSRAPDQSDHFAFRLCGVPFLFFSCGRWEHYHKPTDTFDRLNLTTMQNFAHYLAQLVRKLDAMPVASEPVPDFVRVEAESAARLLLGPDASRHLIKGLAALIRKFLG